MSISSIHVARGLRAEFVGTRGRHPLWTVLVPVMVVVPGGITFLIAFVAERFARIPGQVAIEQVSTSNAAYWVISITVALTAVAAAYGMAAESTSGANEYLQFALPRRWTTPVSKWLFYGVLGAFVAHAMTVLILLGLPLISGLVYGDVSIADPVARRLLWTVPVFAFFAAGLGVGVGALVRTPAGAVGAILFWIYIIETAVGYLPNGLSLQRFMPFLNGIFSTGQDIVLIPPWGQNAALFYTFAVFAAVFVCGVLCRYRRFAGFSKEGPDQMTDRDRLPLAQRPDADLPGHWLLARLGKRVLRPGGVELTSKLLRAANIGDADVVELGPGLGRTARDIVALAPRSYVGVDDSAASSAIVAEAVDTVGGQIVVADAADTGLKSASADVVVGEAMLTMQGDKAKKAIVNEARRVLRPGGRYAIHELGLVPDSLPQKTKDAVRRELAQSIKVNARPLTGQEWIELLREAGFEIDSVETAPMALLRPARVVADEGIVGTLRIVGNLIRQRDARRRVLAMRRTFARYRNALTAVAIVAVVPVK